MKEIYNNFKSALTYRNQKLIDDFILDIKNDIKCSDMFEKYNMTLDNSFKYIYEIEDNIDLTLIGRRGLRDSRGLREPKIELSIHNHTNKKNFFKTSLIYNVLEDSVKIEFSIYTDYLKDICLKMTFIDIFQEPPYQKGIFFLEATNPHRLMFDSIFPNETERTFLANFKSPKLFDSIIRYLENYNDPSTSKEMIFLEYDFNLNNDEIMSGIHNSSVLLQKKIQENNNITNKLS